MSICLLQMVVGSFWFQKYQILVGIKIGSGHCASRAVMFWWFSAKKVKTKVHRQNKRLA